MLFYAITYLKHSETKFISSLAMVWILIILKSQVDEHGSQVDKDHSS